MAMALSASRLVLRRTGSGVAIDSVDSCISPQMLSTPRPRLSFFTWRGRARFPKVPARSRHDSWLAEPEFSPRPQSALAPRKCDVRLEERVVAFPSEQIGRLPLTLTL